MKTSDINDKAVCLVYAVFWEKLTASAFSPVTPPFKELMRIFNAPEKVAFAACWRAEKNGLLEYGVNVSCGWLTDKGKALIDDSRSRNSEVL